MNIAGISHLDRDLDKLISTKVAKYSDQLVDVRQSGRTEVD